MNRRIVLVDEEDKGPVTKSGYEEGKRLKATDGTIYLVDPTGSFRRQTHKPLSKKARRRAERRLMP